MNQDDFIRVMFHLLRASGKMFPHNFIPGAMGEELYADPINKAKELQYQNKFNVGQSKEVWDSYQWNPPQFLQEGVIWAWKDWGQNNHNVPKHAYWTNEPVRYTPQNPEVSIWEFQYAYKRGTEDVRPPAPRSEAQPVVVPNGDRFGIEHLEIPPGWQEEWPGVPCWSVFRFIAKIRESEAISGVDPDAFAKPTWDELQAALKLLNDQDKFHDLKMEHHITDESEKVKRRITENAVLGGLGKLHVGNGLDHMTGLIQMVEQSNISGSRIPAIVLRDENHKPKSLYLQSQVRDLLAEVTERENIVESAHNRIIGPIFEKHDSAFDETKTWAERLALMEEYATMVENYETLLEAEMEKVTPDALPEDLATYRLVHIERLEAKANERIKYMKGVLTQQGIDLDPSCDDEADAIRKVSVASRLGSHAVANAQSKEDAAAAYDEAVKAINETTPLNTPVWNIGGVEVATSNPKDPFEVSGTGILISADHPANTDIPGRCAMGIPKARDKTTRAPVALSQTISRKGETGIQIMITPVGRSTGDVTMIETTARNLCGPSMVTVELTAD